MTRDNRLYLEDIWESIKAIEEYAENLSIETFSANRKTQDAIIRRLEIIGEAVKKAIPQHSLERNVRNERYSYP